MVKGDNGELSVGSHYGIKTSAAASLKAGGHKSILSAGNPGLFTAGSGSRDPDPVNGVGKGNNGSRYKASAPETARMDGVALGLSVNACGELGFSGGSNLTQPMPSLGSLGLLRCGSEPASPDPFDGSKHWNIFCFAIFYVFGVLFFLRFYLIEDYVGKWKKLLTPSLIICFYFETFVGKRENFD